MNDFEENKIQENEALPETVSDTSDGGFVIKESSFKKKKAKKSAEKNKKSRKYGFFSLKYPGVIMSFLFMLAEKISHGLKTGFFGKIFSSLYKTEDEKFQNGFLNNAFSFAGGEASSKSKKAKFRTRFAGFYENSFFCKLISSASRWLVHSYVRLWGMLLFSFGAMLEVVVCMRYFVIDKTALAEHFWTGLVLIILSLPLLSSKHRLGETLLSGASTRYLLIDFLEFDEEKFESDNSRFGGYYSIVFLIGSALGLLSYFVSPLIFIKTFVMLAVFGAIMSFPEIGMMLILCIIPFTSVFANPSLVIMALILLELVSFLFKYLRGKRVIRLEVIDFFVATFGFLVFFGGVISAGGNKSLNSALMYCGFLSAYFLIVNMFRKKELIYKSIKLVICSTSVIAIIGIFQQGSSVINSSWVDLSVFADIGTRVTSLFDNPNMLSIYLIIVFPFVLSEIATSKPFKQKLFYILCAASIVLCTVYTWSRGAWLGIAVATCVFLVAYNLKNIWALVLVLLSLPIWTMLLPENIINRAISIGSVTDSSSFYRIYTWRGVLNMIKDHFFTGIGVGESAFSEVYPIYSYSGTETVMHSHNLFLEITVQLGILGLLVFFAVMFFFAQKCFDGIKLRSQADSRPRTVIVAGLASICGALTMGLTDHIWYNYRVFLLFWAVIALTCALIRINNGAKEKERLNTASNNQCADLDIDSE